MKPDFSKLSNSELREAILSLNNSTHDENSILRKIAKDMLGNDTVLSMVALGVPLALELEKRTKDNMESAFYAGSFYENGELTLDKKPTENVEDTSFNRWYYTHFIK